MDLLIDPLGYAFFVRALVAAAIVGVVCAIIGTFVVLRGLAFMGDAISHAAFPGVVVRQDTVAGTIRIAYYRGQRARYGSGQYAGEFFHYERRLPSGMWDYTDESGALALLTQAIGKGE